MSCDDKCSASVAAALLAKPQAKRVMEPSVFWKDVLKSPRFVVAPMVDNSDLPYRLQCRAHGAEVAYTQMFNANAFITSRDLRAQMFQTDGTERPGLIAQFAGHEPNVVLTAAKYIEDMVDAVDMNFGCPQGIARRGRYGAFLMEELELLDSVVRTLSEGLKVPVTCKTRIYKDFDRSIRLCEVLVNAGASVLTLHGRTRESKGQLVGGADWDTLRRIKAHFVERGIDIPIIANGGISSLEDALKCLEFTGCDAVMSSEAILENPSLFNGGKCSKTGRVLHQVELSEEYLDYVKRMDAAGMSIHPRIIRSHMLKMLYRYTSLHPELRDLCAAAHSVDDFVAACVEVRRSIEKEAASREMTVDQVEAEVYSGYTWYHRHRVLDIDGSLKERSTENPNALLNTKGSFLRDDAAGECWGDDDECGGGIFGAMFGAGDE